MRRCVEPGLFRLARKLGHGGISACCKIVVPGHGVYQPPAGELIVLGAHLGAARRERKSLLTVYLVAPCMAATTMALPSGVLGPLLSPP
jgi:hypothetical protein